jgi:tRNA (guanine9-N1)-methyltransferase
MSSQLSFIYSINRLSSQPFLNVAFTSFEKRLKDRLDIVSHGTLNKWTRISCMPESLGDIVQKQKDDEESPFKGQSLVYLTADSEEELETLKEDETYIIGGIVDRNRYKVRVRPFSFRIRTIERLCAGANQKKKKNADLSIRQNLCRDKAQGLAIRTARLPIGTYLAEMPTRKVLTVNQVRFTLTCLLGSWGF